MLRADQKFDEIHVVEGVGERTGVTFDRSSLRQSNYVCRSVSELSRKVRSHGDGFFYLAAHAWPENTTHLPLLTAWTPIE